MSVLPTTEAWATPAADPPPPAAQWSWGAREVLVPALLLALLTQPIVWLTAALFDFETETLAEDGESMQTSGEKGDGRSLELTLFGIAMALSALTALWTRWRALSLSVPRTRSRRTRAAMAALPVSYGALALFAYVSGNASEAWYRGVGLLLSLALANVFASAMAIHLKGAPDPTLRRLLIVERYAESFIFALHLVVIYPAFYDAEVTDAARVGYLLFLPFIVDCITFPARRVASTRVHGEQRPEMAGMLSADIIASMHLVSRGFVVGMSTATGSLAAAVAASLGEAASRLTISRRDAFYERALCSCFFPSAGAAEEKPTDPAVVAADAKLRKDVVATFLGLDQVLEIWATIVMGTAFMAFRISQSREPPELGAQLGIIGMQLALEVLGDLGPALAAATLQKRGGSRVRNYLELVQRKLELLRGAGRLFWAIVAFVVMVQTWGVLFHMLVPDQQDFFCAWPTTEDPDWFRVPCTSAEDWLD